MKAGYKLQDLIDVGQFQALQDRLNEIYSFPSAIIDNDGNILTATAWQDVCTKFHRLHPEAVQECRKSDQYIVDHLAEANPAVSYRCPHGLIDNATPIVVDGQHLGNYFTGQFFLEPPDLGFFRSQAVRFGFDEAAYLEAVQRVPIWTREQLQSYLFFIKGLIEVVGSIGLRNLRELEARERIQENEAFYRSIVETTADGFWLLDGHGRFLQVNDAYCTMSGYTSEELLTMGVADVEALETPSEVERHIGRVCQTKAQTFETRHRRKDGTLYDVEVSTQYLQARGGQFVAFLRDITGRKRAEEALRRSRQSLAEAQRIAGFGSWDLDAAAGRMAWSDETYRIFGLDPREGGASPSAFLSAVHPDDRAQVEGSLEGGPHDIVHRVVRKRDGEVRYVRNVAEPRLDAAGKASGVTGVIHDITEKYLLEEARIRAQRLEALGLLAGGIAHDFNNLLQGALGSISLAKLSQDDPEPGRLALEDAEKALRLSTKLTSQLLTFSRGGQPVKKLIDLLPVIRSSALVVLSGARSDVRFLSEEGLWSIEGDEGQLGQVIQNVVLNADQAMPEPGRIEVAARNVRAPAPELPPQLAEGRYVEVVVSDTGVGIPGEVMGRVFDPYFTTKQGGSGLGLATAYSIVRKHGGAIDLRSEPGAGTRCRIYLPASESASVPDPQPAQRLPARPPRRGRVLLMDDDDSVLRVVDRLLRKLGHETECAGHGEEAIERYQAARRAGRPFDVCILDLTIRGGMGGLDALRRLRELDPAVKAVVSSGYAEDSTMSDYHEQGFQGVLRKPYTATEVQELLGALLG